MRAGRLKQRLTFQEKPPITRDGYGGEVVSWADVATVWGSVDPIRGREYLEAQQAQADITHRVIIRYRSGIVPTMRIKFTDRESDVRYLVMDEPPKDRYLGGRYLEMMCREAGDE